MSFKGKKDSKESRNKIGEGVKRYYAERETAEMSEQRKEKLREINKQKEDVYKFFIENLQTINKAVIRERMKKKRDNDDVLNDYD